MTTAGQARQAIRALPVGELADILGGETPIVLSPHPDDEVLGCGGLMAAAVRANVEPAVVFVTDGSGSHPRSRKFPRDVLIALRQQEARDAAGILGVDRRRLHFMRLHDTAAPHEGAALAEAVETLAGIVTAYERPVLFAPWAHDPHGDHQAVHKMAVQLGGLLSVRHLSYPVWGWTLPHGQELGDLRISGWRFNLNGNKELKLRALQAHRSQVSALIDDDPSGFRLDADTLRTMLSDDEVFLFNS